MNGFWEVEFMIDRTENKTTSIEIIKGNNLIEINPITIMIIGSS